MRKDHRPYWLKKLMQRAEKWYVRQFLRPRFDALGKHLEVVCPRRIELSGSNICAGDFLHLIAAPHKPIRLSTWQDAKLSGQIVLGNHCLISPGTEISSAEQIRFGDDCMVAADCYISDSDWHGLYHRIKPFRCTRPIEIGDNVWIGRGAIIGKGVRIGDNSVVAAGSVVVNEVAANVVVGGNPAQVIKTLNPRRHRITRSHLFADESAYFGACEHLDRMFLGDNRMRDWIRSQFAPGNDD